MASDKIFFVEDAMAKLDPAAIQRILEAAKAGKTPEQIAAEVDVPMPEPGSASAKVLDRLNPQRRAVFLEILRELNQIAKELGYIRVGWNVQTGQTRKKDESGSAPSGNGAPPAPPATNENGSQGEIKV